MNNHTALGRCFEGAVCAWLCDQGFRLLDRNYTVRGGELDLIMEKDGYTAFIEVKARKDGDNIRRFGRPASAVNAEKREHLIYAAECWLRAHPDHKRPRLDVVEVYYQIIDDFYCLRFRYYPGAFRKG